MDTYPTAADAIRDKDLSVLAAVRFAPIEVRVAAYSEGLFKSRWSANDVRRAEGLPAAEPTIADEPEAPTDDQPEPENDPVEETDPEAETPAGVEP